ncbi:MAG: periplasmic heavy metal sensor [Pseudomonadota bacterium]
MGRGLIILLVVSLGLNVFAVGHLSGRMIANPGPAASIEAPGPRGGFQDPFRLMRNADVLSPESREAFRASFREQLPSLRAEHRQMRELRRELGVLMSADAWDAAAVDAKLQEIRAAQNRQHDAFNTAFMNAFEKLSAEDRKRLIEAAGQRRHDRRGRWRERRERMYDRPE